MKLIVYDSGNIVVSNQLQYCKKKLYTYIYTLAKNKIQLIYTNLKGGGKTRTELIYSKLSLNESH